jgi:hypothetical protein
VSAAHVDTYLLDDFPVIEGVDEAIRRSKEHLAGDGVGAHTTFVLGA